MLLVARVIEFHAGFEFGEAHESGYFQPLTLCSWTFIGQHRVAMSKRLPYCYYYLRVLYFANFCDLEKIAKLSTRKNFYQQTRDSCVYNHKLRDAFRQLWSMHSHSLLVVSAFSFLPCHHELEKVTFDDIDYSGSFTSKT